MFAFSAHTGGAGANDEMPVAHFKAGLAGDSDWPAAPATAPTSPAESSSAPSHVRLSGLVPLSSGAGLDAGGCSACYSQERLQLAADRAAGKHIGGSRTLAEEDRRGVISPDLQLVELKIHAAGKRRFSYRPEGKPAEAGPPSSERGTSRPRRSSGFPVRCVAERRDRVLERFVFGPSRRGMQAVWRAGSLVAVQPRRIVKMAERGLEVGPLPMRAVSVAR